MTCAITLCCLLLGLLSFGNEFHRLKPEEKIHRAGQCFALTFDKYDSNADYAAGNPANIGKVRNLALGLRGTLGFDLAPAYFPEQGETLKFELPGNLNPAAGTVILWVKAQNYDQNQTTPSRSNIGLFEFKCVGEGAYSHLMIYDYCGKTCATWLSSLPGVNRSVVAPTAKFKIRPQEFYQIAVTWNSRELSLYVNGELAECNQLPAPAESLINGTIPKVGSYIAVRPYIYDDKNKYQVVLDDITIYDAVKTPLWIQNQYRKLLVDKGVNLHSFTFTPHGIDNGNSCANAGFELEFDLSLWQDRPEQLRALNVTISADGKPIQTRKCTKMLEFLKNPVMLFQTMPAGRYDVHAELLTADGKPEELETAIELPDTRFIGNRLGLEDTVPAPWTEPELAGRTVKVWNRSYHFGDGPFPVSIQIGGQPLLLKPVHLLMQPEKNIVWKAGAVTRNHCDVVLTGTGHAKGFVVNYRTTVSFDGLIDVQFSIDGEPELDSMALTWQVAPDFTRFLKIPTVVESQQDPYEFAFDSIRPKYLHLVSQKGGFAFNYESDANWRYAPGDPIFSASRANGQCVVRFVNQKVRLPMNVTYHFLFTATPTRPFPERIRGLGIYDESNPDFMMINHPKDAFTSAASFHASKNFEQAMKSWTTISPGRCIYYSMADALTLKDPVMKFFAKYWDIPGRYRYPMDGSITANACTSTTMADYLLANQNDLWSRTLSDRFSMVYYDLCGAGFCANPFHGCAFTDAFGRSVCRSELLSKRQLILRTLRLCRQHGKQLMLHAQRWYYPPLHGLADYWFPGEEHGSIIAANPFGYTDEITDLVWQAEFDRDVVGTAVVMCNAIGWIKAAQKKQKAPTRALLSATLPYDIEQGGAYRNTAVTGEVMTAYRQLGVYGPCEQVTFHRFDVQRDIVPDDEECRISYYALPRDRRVIVVSNPTPIPKTISVRMLNCPLLGGKLLDCISNESLPVVNKTIALELPQRSFRILTNDLSRKIDRPIPLDYREPYTRGVSCWRDFNAAQDGAIRVDFAAAEKPRYGGHLECYPLKPGGRLNVSLELKATGLDAKSPAIISLQLRTPKRKYLPGEVGHPSKCLPDDCREWRKVSFSALAAATDKQAVLALVLGGKSASAGQWLFRNVQVECDGNKLEPIP